jgi:hypothetical protein
MNRGKLVAVVSVALVCAASAGPAIAEPPLVKQAKDQGFPAQNCQYCHVSKAPKKEGWKPDDLNERGKWLLTEKDKRKAKDIKVDWLKDYPGAKEQK